MCFIRYCFLLLCLLMMRCHSLTCKTDGGPKESELKDIYTKCLKMQDVNNSSNSQTFNERDWKDSRDNNERHDREESRTVNDVRKRSRNNIMTNKSNKRDNTNGESGNNDMNSRNAGTGDNDRKNNRHNNMMSNGDDQNEHNRFSGNNEYTNNQHADYMSHYNGYYSSTESPRRYKRGSRSQNSGNRSQYNPNSQRSYEDASRNDGKNSSENNSSMVVDSKACAMHCFLENLEMTGGDGLPDRYLVTQVLTQHVKNEDLHDFLQESIEECFQLLGNENTLEKCEFSKNLLICLSEKGRSNCDDWKDDLKF